MQNLALVLSVGFIAFAAEKSWPTPVAANPAGDATKEAEDIYQGRCSNCHGLLGKGDGPAAAAIKPKPQDFTDKAWQKQASDAEIDKAIVFGGEAVGKSLFMIPNPDLAGKTAVVTALRAKVRNFGK